MEDDVGVRKLFELIFLKEFLITEGEIVLDSSFPTCLQINDFSTKLVRVCLAKHMIIALKWFDDIEKFTCDLLSTPKDYLLMIINTCASEHYYHQNIFESFISVCCLVRYFSNSISKLKGLNYCDLNFDIIMELYASVLKRPFLRCGGFHRLIEYIHHHKYLAWKWNKHNFDSLTEASIPPNADMVKKLDEELIKETNTFKSVQPKLAEIRASVYCMARRVLSTTSVDLSTLPRDHDSNQTEGASGLRDEEETAEGKRIEAVVKLEPLEEIFQECSISETKTNRLEKEKEDIERYENIVQAVTRYNNSKASDLGTSDNHLQKKADGIMKNLKETIESLIDVLDEYEKE